MDQIQRFFSDNSDIIFPLLSAILGSLITYFATSSLDKRKERRLAKSGKVESILVPLCSSIENTLEAIDLSKLEILFVNESNFEDWISKLQVSFCFLRAEKRVFLPKKIRIELEKCKILFDAFLIKLEEELDYCLLEYRKYLNDFLIKFPKMPNTEITMCIIRPEGEAKLKYAIILQFDKNRIASSGFSLHEDIEHVLFPKVNHNEKEIIPSINLRDGIWSIWSMERSDIKLTNDDLSLPFWLVSYIDSNTKDADDVLAKIISNVKQSHQLYVSFSLKIKMLEVNLNKSIDRSTK